MHGQHISTEAHSQRETLLEDGSSQNAPVQQCRENANDELALLCGGGDLQISASTDAEICCDSDGSPRIGNTGVSTRHAGIDWLRIAVTKGSVAPESLRALEDAASAGRQDPARENWFQHGGRVWRLLPRSIGKGSNNLKYVCRAGGVQIGIADRKTGTVASVELEGSFCAGRTPEQLVKAYTEILLEFGVSAERISVSRIDIAVDTTAVSMKDVAAAKDERRLVRRAKAVTAREYADEVTAVEIGRRGTVFLRIYDKVAELNSKGNADKKAAYLAAHGIEELPETLTRIEFEISGKGLRTIWKNSEACLIMKAVSFMIGELMSKWCRVVERVPDAKNRNQTRAKVADWWEQASTDAQRIIDAKQVIPAKPLPMPDLRAKVSQVVGLLGSIAGQTGAVVSCFREAFDVLEQHLSTEHLIRMADKAEFTVNDLMERMRQWSGGLPRQLQRAPF